MAAYAAVVSLMNTMDQIMNHPHLSTCFDNQQVQSLLQTAGSLLEIIEGHSRGGLFTKEAEALERQITSAAYAAEDVIESHVVDQIEGHGRGGLFTEEAEALERQITSAAYAAEGVIESRVVDQIHAGTLRSLDKKKKQKKPKKNKKKGQTLCSLDLQHVIQEMGAVVSKVVLKVKGKGVREDVTSNVPIGGNCITPFTDDIYKDMWRSIVKKQQFEMHVWATLFQEYDPQVVGKPFLEDKEKEGPREEEHPTPHVGRGGSETAMVGLEDELNQLLDSLTDGHLNRHVISIVGMGGTGKTTLAQHIYNHPLIKEYFDIRAWATISQQHNSQGILSQLLSCLGNSANIVGGLGEQIHKTLFGRRYLIVLDDIWDVDAWDNVRRYFPDNGNRSRVILTTRLSNVASTCASACFDMNLLDEEKSWKLFCEKTLFPHKDDPLQLKDVAKRIVKSCNGLALSIVVIGGLLLKSPRTVSYWEKVLKGFETNDSKEKQQGLDALSLSYTHLPPHLKPCFLYLGAFKEDSQLRASKITKLWVAEGFIKPMGSRILEEIAEEYLKDLNDKNLILVVKRHKSGTIKSFSIHDLLRDMCIKVGEQTKFFRVIDERGDTTKGTERRICYNRFGGHVANAVARTILTANRRWNPVRVGKCKLLRVLDKAIHTTIRHDMSKAKVFGNVNLRYFVIQMDSFMHSKEKLPSSACLMWNLQTLIITGWDGLSVVLAPPEIWKIRQLRHVKCVKVYLPDPGNRQDYMENLQTLTGAVNLRLSKEVCLIIPNIKKLGLIYDSELHGHDSGLVECLRNLDRLDRLESLNMEYTVISDCKLGSKLAFPLSLKKLCLSSFMLCWEDLLIVGSLPGLQVLHLKSISRYSEAVHRWSPNGGQFLGLKYLKMENCRLTSWDADSSHFPILEKLVLRHVYSLEEIPLEIGEIPTLELIRVECCEESVEISALKIKKDKLENEGNDTLQIEIAITFKEDVEKFKKRLEAEELDLNLLNKFERYIHRPSG